MFASTIGKASSLRSKFCRWRHMQAKKKKNSTTLNFLHLKNLDDQLRIASQICCPQSHVILHQTDYAMARSRWLPIAEQWKKNLIQTGVSSVSVSKSSMELQQAFSDGGEAVIFSPYSVGSRLTPVFFALAESESHEIPFYCIISEQEYKLMTTESILRLPPSKPNQAIFYRYFFDVKLLEEIPLTSFKGPNSIQYYFMSKSEKYISRSLYLVCFNLRNNPAVEVQDMKRFYKFFHAIFSRTNQRLIPAFETLCPGFGLSLIENGYDMVQALTHISVADWLTIYKMLITSAEYKDSVLRNMIEIS